MSTLEKLSHATGLPDLRQTDFDCTVKLCAMKTYQNIRNRAVCSTWEVNPFQTLQTSFLNSFQCIAFPVNLFAVCAVTCT